MRAAPPWTFFDRPIGEWVYLALLCVSGATTLNEVLVAPSHVTAELAVQALRLVSGLSALGLVVTTLIGLRVGLRFLGLFAASSIIAAPLVTASVLNAPTVDVITAFLGAAIACAVVVWYGRRRLHASITRRMWPALQADHDAAADEFVDAISGMTDAEWQARASEETWSPSDITEHLARTYSQYAGEARGKNSLRIRIGPIRRIFVHLFAKPRLLAGAPFPKARAPRSLRPSGGPPTAADGVALFRATGESCMRDLEILAQRRPYRRLVHPMLGPLPLYEAVRFASLHIRHHRRQLPARGASATGESL